VLAGDKPLLMVTDPPYGVEYDADWRNHAFRSDGSPSDGRAVGKVENDHRADWRETWTLFSGDVIYSWHPAGAPSLVHAAALQDSGFKIRMQIIWAKNQFPIGRGDYHVKHEPCWYCVREGAASARFTKDRTQTTLWQIDKPHKSETGHSTQKPVECMARPIRNHDSEFVYDPFLGSGTTIIACEQLGRKCRAIEISPGYVGVAIQRWADATGKEPKLIK
jgi:DNA modification methylase